MSRSSPFSPIDFSYLTKSKFLFKIGDTPITEEAEDSAYKIFMEEIVTKVGADYPCVSDLESLLAEANKNVEGENYPRQMICDWLKRNMPDESSDYEATGLTAALLFLEDGFTSRNKLVAFLLGHSIYKGYTQLVREMINIIPFMYFNLKVLNSRGDTFLNMMVASPGYNSELMGEFLSKGPKASLADNIGRTPLHIAAEYGNIDAVKWLIAAGADLNAKDKDGSTPLLCAVSHEKFDVAREICKVPSGIEVTYEDIDKLYRLLGNSEDIKENLCKIINAVNAAIEASCLREESITFLIKCLLDGKIPNAIQQVCLNPKVDFNFLSDYVYYGRKYLEQSNSKRRGVVGDSEMEEQFERFKFSDKGKFLVDNLRQISISFEEVVTTSIFSKSMGTAVALNILTYDTYNKISPEVKTKLRRVVVEKGNVKELESLLQIALNEASEYGYTPVHKLYEEIAKKAAIASEKAKKMSDNVENVKRNVHELFLEEIKVNKDATLQLIGGIESVEKGLIDAAQEYIMDNERAEELDSPIIEATEESVRNDLWERLAEIEASKERAKKEGEAKIAKLLAKEAAAIMLEEAKVVAVIEEAAAYTGLHQRLKDDMKLVKVLYEYEAGVGMVVGKGLDLVRYKVGDFVELAGAVLIDDVSYKEWVPIIEVMKRLAFMDNVVVVGGSDMVGVAVDSFRISAEAVAIIEKFEKYREVVERIREVSAGGVLFQNYKKKYEKATAVRAKAEDKEHMVSFKDTVQKICKDIVQLKKENIVIECEEFVDTVQKINEWISKAKVKGGGGKIDHSFGSGGGKVVKVVAGEAVSEEDGFDGSYSFENLKKYVDFVRSGKKDHKFCMDVRAGFSSEGDGKGIKNFEEKLHSKALESLNPDQSEHLSVSARSNLRILMKAYSVLKGELASYMSAAAEIGGDGILTAILEGIISASDVRTYYTMTVSGSMMGSYAGSIIGDHVGFGGDLEEDFDGTSPMVDGSPYVMAGFTGEGLSGGSKKLLNQLMDSRFNKRGVSLESIKKLIEELGEGFDIRANSSGGYLISCQATDSTTSTHGVHGSADGVDPAFIKELQGLLEKAGIFEAYSRKYGAAYSTSSIGDHVGFGAEAVEELTTDERIARELEMMEAMEMSEEEDERPRTLEEMLKGGRKTRTKAIDESVVVEETKDESPVDYSGMPALIDDAELEVLGEASTSNPDA